MLARLFAELTDVWPSFFSSAPPADAETLATSAGGLRPRARTAFFHPLLPTQHVRPCELQCGSGGRAKQSASGPLRSAKKHGTVFADANSPEHRHDAALKTADGNSEVAKHAAEMGEEQLQRAQAMAVKSMRAAERVVRLVQELKLRFRGEELRPGLDFLQGPLALGGDEGAHARSFGEFLESKTDDPLPAHQKLGLVRFH
jgi:hypothetical protein